MIDASVALDSVRSDGNGDDDARGWRRLAAENYSAGLDLVRVDRGEASFFLGRSGDGHGPRARAIARPRDEPFCGHA
jgi:hypothetical protein